MARRASSAAVLALRHAVRASLAEVPPGPVLVGCSGGADSLALAHVLAREAPGRAGLVSVDHGLEPGSDVRAAGVAALGARLGLTPSLAVAVTVEDGGGGPEAAARDARLGALADAAQRYGAGAVYLAHTRDDQAEQVLLGLARGSGSRSLAGMRARRGIFHRPLLGLARATVREAGTALGLTPWEDPHNSDPRFARSRVRHQVLPVLEGALGPGVAAALARSARLLAEDADALDAIAREACSKLTREVAAAEPSKVSAGQEVSAPAGVPAPAEMGARAEVSALAELPPAVRKRVLRLLAEGCGAHGLLAAHLDALDALVGSWHGQGAVALPGGVSGFRRTGRIGFGPSAPGG